VIGFFIGAMIAVVIALQVAWPVMDAAIYAPGGSDPANGTTAIENMSTAASTLVDQLPLFLVLVLLMVFVKAVI
jgi:hypothetical protein